MATYLSPGVYVEERSTGPKPIAGLPTSVAAIVGKTEKGPMMDAVRLSSWNDYLDRFGGYLDDSYTAESAFGFFENGGTALWVVRADNASLSRWSVLDGDNNAAFEIEALSPGAWSGGMAVNVLRDTAGGRGTLPSARLTQDTPSIAGGETKDVRVDSTAGIESGMRVEVGDVFGDDFTADVLQVGSETLRLRRTGTGSGVTVEGPNGDGRVVTVQRTTAPALVLKAGSGFQNGDIIRALTPAGVSRIASVSTARSTGVGMLLSLAQNFDGEVPAMEFTERTVRLRASIASALTNIEFGSLTFEGSPPALLMSHMRRLIAPSGDEAAFKPAAGGTPAHFPFKVPVSAGSVDVDVALNVQPYAETLSPAEPLSDEEILTRFGFIPTGAKLKLTAGAKTFELERIAGTAGFKAAPGATEGPFTSPPATPPPTPLAFNKAEWIPQTTDVMVVQGPAPPEVDDYLDVGITDELVRVKEVQTAEGPPLTYELILQAAPSAAPTAARYRVLAWQDTVVQPLRFGITASLAQEDEEPAVEAYAGLSLNQSSRSYYLADGVINDVSRLITVGPRIATTSAASVGALPVSTVVLQVGAAGTLDAAGIKQGIAALERASEPALIACPDALQLEDDIERADVINGMIGHAEKMRRFSVVDLPPLRDDQDLLEWRLQYLDSTYAAAYAPFVRIVNPRRRPLSRTLDIPASGFVMGVFARTDNERNVWKAPANERVRGIVGPAIDYTKGRQDFLNPQGVNLLRAFPGRGTRIWGARNATTDTEWRYVNVRRLFLFLENSIDAGTQWVVFEPNDATTWLRVRVSVENFLNGVWRAGGLVGATPEQAYRVRVGLGVTMTETDIDLGLLIIEVGVAPSKPAEFVVFRISHKRLTE